MPSWTGPTKNEDGYHVDPKSTCHGGLAESQEEVDKVKTMLRKGFSAMGVPIASLNDLRGERN